MFESVGLYSLPELMSRALNLLLEGELLIPSSSYRTLERFGSGVEFGLVRIGGEEVEVDGLEVEMFEVTLSVVSPSPS